MPKEEDAPVVETMKLIVRGMKAELRQYLKDGGDAATYYERMLERQQQEIDYRNRVVTEIGRAEANGEDVDRLAEDRNEGLRAMGILPVIKKNKKPY